MKVATRQPDLFASRTPEPFEAEQTSPTDAQIEQMRRIVRPRLETLLAAAEGANVLPWSANDAKTNAILFYQMANWLPGDERDAMRDAFRAAYARLGALKWSYPPEGLAGQS